MIAVCQSFIKDDDDAFGLVCPCVGLVHALTFESLDLETLFKLPRLSSYVKAMELRSVTGTKHDIQT